MRPVPRARCCRTATFDLRVADVSRRRWLQRTRTRGPALAHSLLPDHSAYVPQHLGAEGLPNRQPATLGTPGSADVAGSASRCDGLTVTLRQLAIRRALLPLADRFRKRALTRAMECLDQSQWWSHDELVRFQGERLAALIGHVYAHVPYYRETMQSLGLEPGDIQGPNDLSRLPLLTRDRVRAAYPSRICATGVSRDGWKPGRTGGSTTGEPMFFLVDRAGLDYGRAVFYRGLSWAGGTPGTPTLEVWGQPVARLPMADAMRERLIERFFRIHRLDAFQMSRESLERAARLLVSGRFRFVYAYVSALEELCLYMDRRGLRPRGVLGIMTTAEMLLPPTRRLFEDAFGARVFDGYGCGELNGIAYECDRHEGLHVGMERAIVEVVDDEGRPLPPGEPGRLAITDLHNGAMPLIRYINGDSAVLLVERCACGRSLDRIQELLGRTCDIIDGVNGKRAHSYFFASMFASLEWVRSHGLKQFQIVQASPRDLHVRLVIDRRPDGPEEARLRSRLEQYLGPMAFHVEYCERLEPGPSGKLRWTLNHLRTPSRLGSAII
jgi:phenylacetate-CoA ligase